jgi:hypothetical protein
MRTLLGALLQAKGVMKRGTWEARNPRGVSQFQEVAAELKSLIGVD